LEQVGELIRIDIKMLGKFGRTGDRTAQSNTRGVS
jgi:hypothetical protein